MHLSAHCFLLLEWNAFQKSVSNFHQGIWKLGTLGLITIRPHKDQEWWNSKCFFEIILVELIREAPRKKTVLFGTIDPNVGGWTQTFINHCFYGTYGIFLPKISCKFTVKITFCDPNLSFFRGSVGGFTSLVQLYKKKNLFSGVFPCVKIHFWREGSFVGAMQPSH